METEYGNRVIFSQVSVFSFGLWPFFPNPEPCALVTIVGGGKVLWRVGLVLLSLRARVLVVFVVRFQSLP